MKKVVRQGSRLNKHKPNNIVNESYETNHFRSAEAADALRVGEPQQDIVSKTVDLHREAMAANNGMVTNGRQHKLCFAARRTVGLMPEPKIRLQVNVAVAAEAKGGRVGEGFQVAVCTGVVEQAFRE